MSDAFSLEDKPIIVAAYANLDGADFRDGRPVFLGTESGGTWARRMLQRLFVLEGVEL